MNRRKRIAATAAILLTILPVVAQAAPSGEPRAAARRASCWRLPDPSPPPGAKGIDVREWWLRHSYLEKTFREMRDQGMTYEEIAEACNVPSVSIVYTVLDREELVKQERATPILERLRDQVGPTDDAFLAVGYDPVTGGVVVMRVGGAQPPEIAARYTALATSDVPVSISESLLSMKQNQALQDILKRDWAALKAQGIPVETFGVMKGEEPFHIAVRTGFLTPEIKETLLRRYADPYYGRDKVDVIEMGPIVPLNGG
jgi:hypothetical protein